MSNRYEENISSIELDNVKLLSANAVVTHLQKGRVMFLKSRKLLIIVTVFVSIEVMSGCSSAIGFTLLEAVGSIIAADTEDVTALDTFHGEDIWKSYKRDGIYQLKRNLLYGKVFELNRDEYELFPPWNEHEHGASRMGKWNSETGETVDFIPESIEAYNSDPAKWVDIKGVIPKGTKLRMAHVIFEQTIDTHEFYYIAIFVDGPFAGKPVLLTRMSTNGFFSAQSYNSYYLEQVNAP